MYILKLFLLANIHYKSVCIVIATLILSSCATLPPGGENVALHMYSDADLQDCIKLGSVTTEVLHPTMKNLVEAEQQARYNLQAEAYHKYGSEGANAVRVTYINQTDASYKTQGKGIAYRCNQTINNKVK